MSIDLATLKAALANVQPHARYVFLAPDTAKALVAVVEAALNRSTAIGRWDELDAALAPFRPTTPADST